MTENFENDAHDYLLQQMEAGRRGAFELELQRNPAAAAALKRYADSFAGFACEVAGAEALSAADHRTVLAGLAGATRTSPAARRQSRPARVEWLRFFWPVAAALLLLLNLIEFQRPLAPQPSRDAAATTTRNENGASRNPDGSRPGAAESDESTDAEADAASTQADAGSSTAATAARDAQRELEDLRANVAVLRRDQARLRAEYDLLIRKHAEQRAADRSLNRLATMELVDAASYARGERRGLVAVGRGILSEPGVVITPDTGIPPPITGAIAAETDPAYAWSVFDETAHQGSLNLYNLPVVAEGEAIQVWVRPADTNEFQRVAEVPAQFYGRSGTVQYTLPESSAPAEILITVEPRGGGSTAPTGAVVLRGP